MKQITHVIKDLGHLKLVLASEEIRPLVAQFKTTLVQVFTAQNEHTWIQAVVDEISQALPGSVIVGATTCGEIAHGHTLTEQTVVTFSFFRSSSVTPIAMLTQPGKELEQGRCIRQEIDSTDIDVAGVLILATPLSLDAVTLLQGMSENPLNYPIFGGGAADYGAMNISMVFSGSKIFSEGIIAVVFSGTELHVESMTYLGWQPLSKEMTITEVDGMLVKSVDDKPAFRVYQRYLDIINDEQFFTNTLEFPFLLERSQDTLARVPVAVDDNGAIQFIADVNEGDKFRIGYGSPAMIIHGAGNTYDRMQYFEPDAIFLYTCGCRRFLMQEDVDLETVPFEKIAPTSGFYTYGEFYGRNDQLNLLNSTMVVVGLREGAPRKNKILKGEQVGSTDGDPYQLQHFQVVSRLIHFIGAVTKELEQSNQELMALSVTDKLTQVYNRAKLDEVLKHELALADRYKSMFSVILLDIDNFKLVNDVYGHHMGDLVLTRIATLLMNHLRETDVLGRWGGEEFLIILPNNDLNQAEKTAEKLRAIIADEVFVTDEHHTCSFGVTEFHPEDTEKSILIRADEALYEAKNNGRNKVSVKQV